MRRNTFVIYVVVISAALLGLRGQAGDAALSKDQAIEIIRSLNTIELESFLKTKSYLELQAATDKIGHKPSSLTELVLHGEGSSQGTLRGYDLSFDPDFGVVGTTGFN